MTRPNGHTAGGSGAVRAARRLLALALLIAAAAPAPCLAQDGGGGTRSVFTLGAGSRAIAMGGAFTAIGDDASVLYYNPAALKRNPAPTLMASHIQLFSGFTDATYDYFGLAWPTLGAGSFGAGLLTTGTGGIRGFDEFSRETGEFSYRESQGILSYAFDVPWRWVGLVSVGASLKVVNQTVGEFADTGTGVDLGLLYRQDWLPGLVLGMNLQDIVGARTKLVSVSDKVYRTMMFGLGYTRRVGAESAMTIAVQMDMPELADTDYRFGAEFTFKRMVSIRLGYDSEQITAGLGIGWRGYTADYGYFSREEAGSWHPLTLSEPLGTPIEERARRREDQRRIEEERRLAEFLASRVAQHIGAAEQYRDEGELESAIDEVKIALEYEPGSERARALKDEIGTAILAEQQERTRDAERNLLISQHFGLGLEYYNNNEFILARAEWRNVLELDPRNEQASDYLERTESRLAEEVARHETAAAEHERNGQSTRALSEWTIVRSIEPENERAAAAIERIGSRLESLDRDYRTAERRLETIRLFQQAVGEFNAGRYGEAAGLLRQVLQREPDHAEARDLLGRAERRMKPLTAEENEAIRRLHIEALKFSSQKDYQAAIDAWRKILDIDPDNDSASKNIEDAQQRLRRLESPEGE
ncbi:MAG: PorV/PorQ family protein [Candidatus Krumholzibacteria bacterium]|nr:PorV/PorQ family protein [Candidatus Krumholzibacteria bacterium]